MSSKNIETRDRILIATLKSLEANAAPTVRMSDIAKAAKISRQAVYLHFPTRAELLIAATHYLDHIKDVDHRLEKSRNAKTGKQRLNAYIEAWGNYIPEIYGVAKALLAMKDTDEAANIAWSGRMNAVREGCEAAIMALKKDGMLASDYTIDQATDVLWTMLSLRNWEQLTQQCGWTQAHYIKMMKSNADRIFVRT